MRIDLFDCFFFVGAFSVVAAIIAGEAWLFSYLMAYTRFIIN